MIIVVEKIDKFYRSQNITKHSHKGWSCRSNVGIACIARTTKQLIDRSSTRKNNQKCISECIAITFFYLFERCRCWGRCCRCAPICRHRWLASSISLRRSSFSFASNQSKTQTMRKFCIVVFFKKIQIVLVTRYNVRCCCCVVCFTIFRQFANLHSIHSSNYPRKFFLELEFCFFLKKSNKFIGIYHQPWQRQRRRRSMMIRRYYVGHCLSHCCLQLVILMLNEVFSVVFFFKKKKFQMMKHNFCV